MIHTCSRSCLHDATLRNHENTCLQLLGNENTTLEFLIEPVHHKCYTCSKQIRTRNQNRGNKVSTRYPILQSLEKISGASLTAS